MNIKLKEDYAAILSEESGETVAVLLPRRDSMFLIQELVGEHFDVAHCELTNPSDFDQELEDWKTYTFKLNDEDYVKLIMTYAPIY